MKVKKKNLFVFAAVAILLVTLLFYLKPFAVEKDKNWEETQKEWNVDDNGYLHYPLERGSVSFRRENHNETDSLIISKMIFESRNGNVYGLLVLPKSTSVYLPGVVLLPGAGVSKESGLGLAKQIAEKGAAVLVLDQRGVGETDGKLPSLQEDYVVFSQGSEPYQHLMVYDALRAYDLLKSAPFIDAERIIMAGESLGGRIAIIAAAIDRNIKGALVISSSGFGFQDKGDKGMDRFIKSIDPDHYIGLITPRKLVMIHNANDGIVPAASAAQTYIKAEQPKRFALVNDTSCNHGYCGSMNPSLMESLDFLVGLKAKGALNESG